MNEVKKMKPENFLDNFGRSESMWMYACSRCGECVDVCPVYQETGDKYTAPGFKIKKMRGLVTKKFIPGLGKGNAEDVKKIAKGLYECTLCGRCWSVCPYNYDLVGLWERARESTFENGFALEPLLQMVEALEAENNIFKRPHLKRGDWAKGLDVPIKEEADTVYFTGCLLSYRGQLKPAAKAVAAILNAVGENWTILKDEVCCGAPLRFAGGTKHFTRLMETNINAIRSTGANKIVFSCPGCYRMFWQEYSKVLSKDIQMLHMVELIDNYIESGRLKFKGRLEEKITYHDPCELSRLSGVFREPRHIFANIATKFAELPENKFNVKCCGGGGLFKAANTEKSLELGRKRVGQAEKIGATTLTVACPSCYETLSQAAHFKKSNLKVIDIAEAVAQQI
jgi:heterodisulfide reductase subunit D